jgi:hypothetical protein
MTFLNPALLWALPLAGIPLLIHLFTRYRRKRILFSSLQFLRLIESRRIKRLRWQQWLLIILRTLALALLALGFSRPAFRNTAYIPGEARHTSAVIILDNSFSMSRSDSGDLLLHQAREAVQNILAAFEETDEIFLLTAGEPRKEGPPYQGETPRHIRVQLEETGSTFRAFDVSQAVLHARELLAEARYPAREIYCLSDFQVTAFSVIEMPANTGSDIPLYCLPIGSDISLDNQAVLDVVLESRILEPRRELELTAVVGRTGGRTPRDVALDVFLNGARVARKNLTLSGDAQVREPIHIVPEQGGALEGFVEIDADGLPGDNRRYFSVQLDPAIRVLNVHPPEYDAPYVRLAVTPNPADSSQIVMHSVSPAHLSDLSYADYQVMIWNNITGVSRSEVDRILRAQEQGMGLLCLLGDQTDVVRYNRDVAPVLGLPRILRVVGQSGDAAAFSSFDNIQYQHPLFDGLFAADPVRVQPARIYFSFELEPSGDPLISLGDGREFLVSTQNGRTLVMGGAPAPGQSDFHVRGLFAPLLHRAVRYLATAGQGQNPGVLVGEPITFTLPQYEENTEVVRPDQVRERPVVAVRGESYLLTCENNREPGAYRLSDGHQLLRSYSVNIDPRESDLRIQDSGALSAMSGDGPFIMLNMSEDITERIQTLRFGTEVGRFCLLLALLMLGLEMAVVRWSFSGGTKAAA